MPTLFFGDLMKSTDKELLKNLPTHRLAYSDRMAYLMGLMSCFAYEKTEEDLVEKLNFYNFSLMRFDQTTDTEWFAAKSREEGFIVISFRGTNNIPDVWTDLTPFPKVKGGKSIHGGFCKAYDKVCAEVESLIHATEETVFVTGHSLGGALATIACSETVPNERLAACYTFGAPSAGDSEFSQSLLKFPVYRVVHRFDVVSRVPPWHMGTGYLTIVWGSRRYRGQKAYMLHFISFFIASFLATPLFIAAILLRCIKAKPAWMLGDHFMERYLSSLKSVAYKRKDFSSAPKKGGVATVISWGWAVVTVGWLFVPIYLGIRSLIWAWQ